MKNSVVVTASDQYTLKKLKWVMQPYFADIIQKDIQNTNKTAYDTAAETSKAYNSFAVASEKNSSLVVAKNGRLIFSAEVDAESDSENSWRNLKEMFDWFVNE